MASDSPSFSFSPKFGLKPVLVGSGAVIAFTVALALVVHRFNSPSDLPPPAPANEHHKPASPPNTSVRAVGLPEASVSFDRDLAAILADPAAAQRQARLRAWADALPLDQLEATLNRIQMIDSSDLRAEVRQALLYSWTSRDLVAVARWFGTPGPAFGLRQEGRDQLVLALLQCDPEAVIPALQTALPAATSRELYGPYFRGWAATQPALAADTLRDLAARRSSSRLLWDDLIAQVAAQWVASEPERAVAWVQALPESAAKTRAQIQTGYRWTEINPAAASAYAAQQNDPRLAKTVAAKWAEAHPAAALAWAQSLTDNNIQSHALTGAASAWAQADPLAAAAYAAGLKPSATSAEIAGAVVAAWAFSDPVGAAQWTDALPPGLPRDRAVNSLCVALYSTSPDQAFRLAGTIADTGLRDTGLQRAARAWMQTDPSAAHAAITETALPDVLKQRLLGNAAP